MKKIMVFLVIVTLVAVGVFAGGGQEPAAESGESESELEWVIQSGDFIEVNAWK